MESNNCLHSPLRLSYSVGRPRLSLDIPDMTWQVNYGKRSFLNSFYILIKISRECVMENQSAVF